MHPPEKQFSPNREASRKHIPVSKLVVTIPGPLFPILFRFTLAAILLPLLVDAGEPRVVRDIHSAMVPRSSSPEQFFVFGNQALFVARTDADGEELWITDGTEAGTRLVRDIRLGVSGAPEWFAELNGEVLFAANDGPRGVELFKTDGTGTGTRMVKDIRPVGTLDSDPKELTTFKGRV